MSNNEEDIDSIADFVTETGFPAFCCKGDAIAARDLANEINLEGTNNHIIIEIEGAYIID